MVDEIVKEESNEKMVPYTRFKKVIEEKNEAYARVAELESSLDEYKGKIEKIETKNQEWKEKEKEYKKLEKQIEDIRMQEETELRNKWADISKQFDVKEGDALYEKVSKLKESSRFKLGEDASLEDIKSNINNYHIYKEAGYFDIPENTNEIKKFEKAPLSPSVKGRDEDEYLKKQLGLL